VYELPNKKQGEILSGIFCGISFALLMGRPKEKIRETNFNYLMIF
jgi:hypothetical protein